MGSEFRAEATTELAVRSSGCGRGRYGSSPDTSCSPCPAGKYGASLPKGPLIQLFGGYEGAKQTLGASREDRARFERAGKIVEQRATVLSRQMKGM